MERASPIPDEPAPTRALVPFVLATYGIAWTILGLYVLAPAPTERLFGPIHGGHPLFFLATWSPAIAGVGVVLAYCGPAGLRAFARRLLAWRIPVGWAAFVLLGLPLVFVAGSLAKGGPVLAPLPPEGAGALLAVLGTMLFLGPVEELGWRGVAQPLLQRRMAPLFAGMLIGAAWGLWHLPAFFLAGTVFGGWSFLPFFAGNVVLGVLVTPLLNRSGGGLLWPMLFHWQLINPFWPDAQPWDTAILAGVAVAVVVLNRETMLRRAGAATAVAPGTGPRLGSSRSDRLSS